MTPVLLPSDPLEAVPSPDEVRLLLADANRRCELLRSLLRVAIRKANYPPPSACQDIAANERAGGVRC